MKPNHCLKFNQKKLVLERINLKLFKKLFRNLIQQSLMKQA